MRPDGRISLQLVGEIIVAGHTPAELGAILTEHYGREIKEPEVTVIVRSFTAQKIYVDGEVDAPTLLDLVLMPYDLVYVPKSPIGNVNAWVDQYISGVLPSELLTIWLIQKN